MSKSFAAGLVAGFSMLAACAGKEQTRRSAQVAEGGLRYEVILEPGPDSTSRLACYMADTLASTWPLPYPVYRFQHGDVNGDSIVDIGVGVVKTTRRDPVVRRRLFLFQVQNGQIIPLWLGSGLSRPLHDFRIIADVRGTFIRSVEVEPEAGTYLVAEYAWYGFGPSFSRYVQRDISLKEAERLLAE